MKSDRRQFLASGTLALLLAVIAKPAWAELTVIIDEDPNCGCCHLWAEAMQKAGFDVRLNDVGDLAPIEVRCCEEAKMEDHHHHRQGDHADPVAKLPKDDDGHHRHDEHGGHLHHGQS